jgi:uncharacterized Zn finger protein
MNCPDCKTDEMGNYIVIDTKRGLVFVQCRNCGFQLPITSLDMKVGDDRSVY